MSSELKAFNRATVVLERCLARMEMYNYSVVLAESIADSVSCLDRNLLRILN